MAGVFHRGKLELSDKSGGTDWTLSDVRAMLMGPGYVYAATSETVADIVADELANAGYARASLTGRTLALDGGSVKLDADDAVFGTPAAGDLPAGVVIFRSTGDDATSPLLAYAEFDGLQEAPAGVSYTVRWSANGAIRLTD